MEHRGESEKIQRVLESDGPADLRCVSGCVAERPVHALHQQRQALVLALCRRRLEQVERQARIPPLMPNASSTSWAPSLLSPVLVRILSATLFVASKTAWK